jgi:hypothetical protein
MPMRRLDPANAIESAFPVFIPIRVADLRPASTGGHPMRRWSSSFTTPFGSFTAGGRTIISGLGGSNSSKQRTQRSS